ncbi:MAG TPA: hypothetical protein VF767_02605 [Bryobacteraceae bacterium]
MYHKIHRWVDVDSDSVDSEPDDTPQEAPERGEGEIEELPDQPRRPLVIAEE